MLAVGKNEKSMKTSPKNFVLLAMLIAGLGLLLVDRVAAQTYTFGPQIQSTPSASITYDSGTGTFQYTDAANSSDDYAGLPLSGNAATYITISNGWTASITANLYARPMTATAVKVLMLEWVYTYSSIIALLTPLKSL